MNRCLSLAFALLMLPAGGCDSGKKNSDMTNRLNELHQQRADSDVLEHLNARPAEQDGQEASDPPETPQ